MRRQVRGQMRGQVRSQELTPAARARAARRLLEVYAGLASRQAHLLGGLLADGPPAQWERLPADDAVDSSDLFQWFYHCHAPEDRPGAAEHGHFHLFAKRALWEPRVGEPDEIEFAKLAGAAPEESGTRHLLGVSLDAKGVPLSLFALDSSATGDAMLSVGGTLRALRAMKLDTGFLEIDRVLESVVALFDEDLQELLERRDEALRTRGRGAGSEPGADVLSAISIDLDSRLEAALRATRPTRRQRQEDPRRPRPARARAETSAGPRGR